MALKCAHHLNGSGCSRCSSEKLLQELLQVNCWQGDCCGVQALSNPSKLSDQKLHENLRGFLVKGS